MTRLSSFTLILVLSLLPVAGVPVSVAGLRLPLIVAGLVPLALLAPSTLCTSSGALRTLIVGLPFWLGLGGYLTYLGVYSAALRAETLPMFFFGRLGILFAAYVLGVLTLEAIKTQRLEKIFSTAAVAGLLIVVLLFVIGTVQAGYTVSSFVDAARSLDVSAYMRLVQRVFTVWGADPHSTTGHEFVPVLKNSLAEGTASLLILLVIAMTLRSRERTTLNSCVAFGLAVLVALTLSRSVAISCLFAGGWLAIPYLHRQTSVMVTGVAVAGLLSLCLWQIYHNELSTSAEAFTANRQRSSESRALQLQSALRHQHSARNGWLFGDGPYTGYEGVRIHNLLLSAWVEGGVLAVAAIMSHAVPVLLRLLSAMSAMSSTGFRNALLHCGCAIPLLVGLRTLTNGSGGFYTIAGLLAMGCFWGICAGADTCFQTNLIIDRDLDEQPSLPEIEHQVSSEQRSVQLPG